MTEQEENNERELRPYLNRRVRLACGKVGTVEQYNFAERVLVVVVSTGYNKRFHRVAPETVTVLK